MFRKWSSNRRRRAYSGKHYETFGEDPRVEQYQQAIHDRVTIPGPAAAIGTDKLPSDDVDEMDASIPRHPPCDGNVL
jgi:hypothetical protein